MKNIVLTGLVAGMTLCALPGFASAHDDSTGLVVSGSADGIVKNSRADSHAPMGVMGDHMHKAGEWMVSYRYMRMHMEGNRDGTDGISDAEIVTSVPNRFAGMPGQPATLRVVPQEMDMQMHMFGMMYAPVDGLTLMAMASYMDKDMDSVTYAGMAGTTVLGTSTMKSQGWGDTKLTGLVRLYDDTVNHVHFNAGLSIPSGSLKEHDTMLMPNGMRMDRRLAYGMQLGSGTWDLEPGVTYTGHKDRLGWGLQYKSVIRLGENSQDYTLGDKQDLTGWASYLWLPELSTSLRMTASHESRIDGIDSEIVGPMQAADPDNYGGRRIELGFGLNLLGTEGTLKNHRLAAEVTVPVYQDLNGPQLERDYAFTLGYQFSF
jgi:hypothetical protein